MQSDDAAFGPMTFDADIDAWVGAIRFTSFDPCRIRWSLSPDGEIRPSAEDADAGLSGGLGQVTAAPAHAGANRKG